MRRATAAVAAAACDDIKTVWYIRNYVGVYLALGRGREGGGGD